MPSRLRSALSAALITLSCLLVPFGALAAWASYALADTGRYVTAMAPLATDPHIRDAVADTVGADIMREVDRQTDGPERDAVGPFVHDAVRSFTRTRAFRVAWDAGNRATHDAVLRALRESDGGDADRGPVTVDLAQVTTQVKDELTRDHVPFAARIPVQHTEFAVLPADELTHLRKGFHILEVAGFWLPVAAVVFAVTGIGLAVRRRRAITATALGTALGGAVLGLALAVGRRLTLGDLPADVPQPAAGAVYDALTATLRTVSWLLLVLGLTVAVTTWLTRNVRVPGASRHPRDVVRGTERHSCTAATDTGRHPRTAAHDAAQRQRQEQGQEQVRDPAPTLRPAPADGPAARPAPGPVPGPEETTAPEGGPGQDKTRGPNGTPGPAEAAAGPDRAPGRTEATGPAAPHPTGPTAPDMTGPATPHPTGPTGPHPPGPTGPDAPTAPLPEHAERTAPTESTARIERGDRPEHIPDRTPERAPARTPERTLASMRGALVRRALASRRAPASRRGLAPSGGHSYPRGRDLTARPAEEDEAVEVIKAVDAVEAEPGGWGRQPPSGPTPTS